MARAMDKVLLMREGEIMSVFNTAYDDVCRYRDRCKCGACGAPLSYPFVCWQGGDAAEAAASEIDARIFDLHERGQ